MNNIDIGTYWTNGVRVPWFTKKTGRLVSKSYAVQKQREEVVEQFSQIISLWKILATPSTQGTSLRITRFEKKTKKKKKKKKEYKKSATDTNQQLYQKNYHRGLKDKCS